MLKKGFPGGSDDKESACSTEIWVRSLGREDSLEEGLATHCGILAWRIPWTEEPDGCSPWGRKESDTNEAPKQHYTQNKFYIMSD